MRMILSFTGICTLALLLSCGAPNQGRTVPESEPAVESATGVQALTGVPAQQEPERFGDVLFDHRIHDFGTITTASGPQTCTFLVTNLGEKPIAIYEVASSCGCTNVTWTKQPIKTGEAGTITATFENADGPYPFDKTLTVYVSGLSKPVVLHLRGVVTEELIENEAI